ncbi:hypothetical protein PAAG_11208 [Paracoccidioides lutzii Pb01]|uniref:Uncharacterized protein n=1 Tax=Paracoccidioides lutzii (strain ATCC MYA-826 / Pb01) TaxID=502779 RepID=A0A0A2V6Q9_PARBA|nr:hypothetical protein PAAG_11208 [Paracoccidioides lutzii Pb01]KGQ02032.1 hypothetical protein PAAG_11208 [Paracoccidioides lutzii Pb01]
MSSGTLSQAGSEYSNTPRLPATNITWVSQPSQSFDWQGMILDLAKVPVSAGSSGSDSFARNHWSDLRIFGSFGQLHGG